MDVVQHGILQTEYLRMLNGFVMMAKCETSLDSSECGANWSVSERIGYNIQTSRASYNVRGSLAIMPENKTHKTHMKNTKQKTIGDEIFEQIHTRGTTFTIKIVEDCIGQPTIVLKDNDYCDMTIIQTIDSGIKVTYFDNTEIEAIKSMLL